MVRNGQKHRHCIVVIKNIGIASLSKINHRQSLGGHQTVRYKKQQESRSPHSEEKLQRNSAQINFAPTFVQGVKFQPHYIHIFCPDGKNDNDHHDYLFLVGFWLGGWLEGGKVCLDDFKRLFFHS